VIVVRDAPSADMHPFDDIAAGTGDAPRAPRGPHEIASLFYTSGTTADPKGVMHTPSTLGSFARNNARVAGAGADDGSLLQFPLTHIGGIAAFLMVPLLLGSRTVYLDVWDPERAIALIEREQLTSAGGPPPILQGILNAPGFDRARVRTLKVAGTGAADIPPELVRDVRRRLAPISYRSYGLTECPMLTSGGPSDPEDKCASTDGRPTGGCTVRIVDERGAAVAAGVEGEIEAFGPQMCVGYLDSHLNADAFTADGYVRSGDLGVMDDAGYVRVTGRKKDIIIRKGENLSAKAIEDILHEHPAIADAAVVGVPDPETGERACACVVLRDAASPLTLDDIRRFMEGKQVMRQKMPEQLEIMTALPRTATGKVMKNELRRALRK
jgi:cyclohexanecarboxylate-CoA ligase